MDSEWTGGPPVGFAHDFIRENGRSSNINKLAGEYIHIYIIKDFPTNKRLILDVVKFNMV